MVVFAAPVVVLPFFVGGALVQIAMLAVGFLLPLAVGGVVRSGRRGWRVMVVAAGDGQRGGQNGGQQGCGGKPEGEAHAWFPFKAHDSSATALSYRPSAVSF